MAQNLPLKIGLRYSRARRRNGFISFISMISIIGIALGVWALITVISIMNGFEKELRGRILDVASHVTLSGPNGWLPDWQVMDDQIKQINQTAGHEVAGQAPYILGQGLATLGNSVNGALIRGVLPEREVEVSSVFDHLDSGSVNDLQAGKYRVILGDQLAYKLGVGVGDKVTLVAPQGQSTPAGLLPRMRRFEVAGLFNIGMYEYDSTLAIVHIQDAARLYKAKDQVSGIRLKLDDVYQAPYVSRTLLQELGYQYYVSDWTEQHANFFRALAIEKRVMFIILFLIVAVAAFNIVSTLVMVVTDKQSDIAILRTLGLSPAKVMGIFFVQGVTSGVIGTLIGVVVGVLTALNVDVIVPFLENLLGFQFFPADVYVISDFPAELHWSDVWTIGIMALGMSMFATLYPAYRASKTQPAEALRYE
jgi:lipoprotein-releasing system permease protein